MNKKTEILQKTPSAEVDAGNGENGTIAPVQLQIAAEPKEMSHQILAYIGPSFKGAVKGTVYNNGIPQSLREMVTKKPSVGQFLVPIHRLALANKELADPDSAFSRLYRIAEAYINTKGE